MYAELFFADRIYWEMFSKMPKCAKFGVNLWKNKACQFFQNFRYLFICLFVSKKYGFIKFVWGIFCCWYDLSRNFSKMSKYAKFRVNLRKNEPCQFSQNFRNLCICLLVCKKHDFVKFVCGIFFLMIRSIKKFFENVKICQIWGKSAKTRTLSVI